MAPVRDDLGAAPGSYLGQDDALDGILQSHVMESRPNEIGGRDAQKLAPYAIVPNDPTEVMLI